MRLEQVSAIFTVKEGKRQSTKWCRTYKYLLQDVNITWWIGAELECEFYKGLKEKASQWAIGATGYFNLNILLKKKFMGHKTGIKSVKLVRHWSGQLSSIWGC